MTLVRDSIASSLSLPDFSFNSHIQKDADLLAIKKRDTVLWSRGSY